MKESLHRRIHCTNQHKTPFLASYAFKSLVIFQVYHTVLLSTLGDSTYRFGTTYAGSKQAGPSEVRCGKLHLNIFPV